MAMNTRRTILAVLIPAAAILAAGLFLVSPADAQTFRQDKTNSNGNANTLQVILPSLPLANNLLVMVGAMVNGPLSTPTGGGATWSKATASYTWTNVEIWYGITDGSSATVNISSTAAAGNIWMQVSEWSGMTTGSVLDTAAAGTGTSGTSPASASAPSITTTQANDLLIFGVSTYTSETFVGTPAPGTWTPMAAVAASGDEQAEWYRVVSATGAYQPAISISGPVTIRWDAAIAAFKAAKICTSVATGNWNVTATWAAGCTGGPVAGDIVTINNLHTVTVTANAASSTLTINAGGVLSVGAFSLAVSGATSVTGTLNITNATGAKTFTGNVTINGTWTNSGDAAVSFGGNLTNNNVFTAGAGIQTFTGAGKTFSGAMTIPNMSVTGTYTNSGPGSLRATLTLAGSGTLTNGSNGTLFIGDTSTITNLTADAADVPPSPAHQHRGKKRCGGPDRQRRPDAAGRL
jgi:hypothetical protein